MKELVAILVPIAICVVLPVALAWLYFSQKKKQDSLRAEVMLEAIRQGKDVDLDALAKSLSDATTKKKSLRKSLMNKLLWGCICSMGGLVLLISCIFNAFGESDSDILVAGAIVMAVGISFLIVYFVGHKNLVAEEAEEKRLQECEENTVELIER